MRPCICDNKWSIFNKNLFGWTSASCKLAPISMAQPTNWKWLKWKKKWYRLFLCSRPNQRKSMDDLRAQTHFGSIQFLIQRLLMVSYRDDCRPPTIEYQNFSRFFSWNFFDLNNEPRGWNTSPNWKWNHWLLSMTPFRIVSIESILKATPNGKRMSITIAHQPDDKIQCPVLCQ